MRQARPSRREARLIRSATGTNRLVATRGLIAANVIVFGLGLIVEGGGLSNRAFSIDYGLFGPSIALDGEWWRIITAGFLHAGLVHLGMNMLALWILGQSLEPALGPTRFGVLYAAGLVGGSLGALLIEPTALAVGASGAIFGLMGGLTTGMHARGVNPFTSGIGSLLLINLLLTFTISGISIGGHIGGLVAGAVVGRILLDPNRRIPAQASTLLSAGLVMAVMAASLWAADQSLGAF